MGEYLPSMRVLRTTGLCVLILHLLACDDGTGAAEAPGAGSPGAGSPDATAAPVGTSAAQESLDEGSVASLRDKASKIMDALKKGDAKAAAAFCLGKHREAFEKYLAETIEKKDQSRSKGYQAYDGKLGAIRIKGDLARVAFHEEGDQVDFLSFRKKDGVWSFDDTPWKPKAEFDGWGELAPE